MRRIIEELIQDFVATPPGELTPREIAVPTLPAGVNKSIAFVGMRRTGKTSMMRQFIRQLGETGTAQRQCVFLNLEDERLASLRVEHLRLLLDVQAALFPDVFEQPRYLFLDEIQVVSGWERFVRRVLDEGVRVFLSGSSSRMLSRELHTALRGRGVALEVAPFSFREALNHEGLSFQGGLAAPERALLRNRFGRYLRAGGFPEVQRMDERLRIATLQEYVGVAVHRDIVERHRLTSPLVVRWLSRHLLENATSPFTANRAYHRLRSEGIGVGKDLLYAAIEHFRDAFLAFFVEICSPSRSVRMTNPRKVYVADPGLITAFSWRFSRNTGVLLENAVYNELRRRFDRICYYRTAAKTEVDFLCTDPQGRPSLFQVCADLSAPSTRDREMAALRLALDELDLPEGVVIAMDEEEEETQDGRTIRVVPAWRWFTRPYPD